VESEEGNEALLAYFHRVVHIPFSIFSIFIGFPSPPLPSFRHPLEKPWLPLPLASAILLQLTKAQASCHSARLRLSKCQGARVDPRGSVGAESKVCVIGHFRYSTSRAALPSFVRLVMAHVSPDSVSRRCALSIPTIAAGSAALP
jgi:hypothetical protein